MKDFTVVLSLDYDTKNTIRYSESGDTQTIRAVYVPKSMFNGQMPPPQIEVHVKARRG